MMPCPDTPVFAPDCPPGLSDEQHRALTAFLERLLQANQRQNLTAITDPAEAWQRHILESLALSPLLPDGANILDIGSGGGLPGIPLAIARPRLSLTLLEATSKKARFLEETTRVLQLDNVSVWNERAELAARDPARRASFDWATARAVGELPELVELALPFLRVGGRLIAIKGERAGQEIERAANALRLVGGTVADVLPLHPGNPESPGRLIIIAKPFPTPSEYPRANGLPKKRPL